MAGTQITFTNDALKPKVITFGGSPLVKWYAYILEGQNGRLYLRRSVDGILGSEILVMEANPPTAPKTESIGITWFAFHVDPTDATKAYIYFIADGTLWRSEVTSSPIGEEPTTQQFDRTTNRYENADLAVSPNRFAEGYHAKTTIPTPGIALVETANPAARQLIVTVPPADNALFEPDTIEVYRLIDGGNGTLYYSGGLPGGRQLVLTVATNTATFTKWAARVTKRSPAFQSVFVSVIDSGNLDTDAFGVLAPSRPLEAYFAKVDRAPIKRSLTETATQLATSPSRFAEAYFDKLDRAPIKRNLAETAVSLALSPSFPLDTSFQKS